ncbi:MAG: hypothetical protein ACYC4U_10630 [Pirellulaceae bacterium]
MPQFPQGSYGRPKKKDELRIEIDVTRPDTASGYESVQKIDPIARRAQPVTAPKC